LTAIKEGGASHGQDRRICSWEEAMLGAAESTYVVIAVLGAFGLFSCVLGGAALFDALGRRQ
jgi:hypothetical protein